MKILMASYIGGVEIGDPAQLLADERGEGDEGGALNNRYYYDDATRKITAKLMALTAQWARKSADAGECCPYCKQPLTAEQWGKIVETTAQASQEDHSREAEEKKQLLADAAAWDLYDEEGGEPPENPRPTKEHRPDIWPELFEEMHGEQPIK